MQSKMRAGRRSSGLHDRLWAGLPVMLLTLLLLAGCGRGGTGDLAVFVADTQASFPGQVEPLPEFTEYRSVDYAVADRRDPFVAIIRERTADATEEGTGPRPDMTRPREALEEFPLDGLRLVGFMRRGGVDWAIIRDPVGDVHRVTVGNYLGRNHGRITAVEEGRIDFVELVQDARGAWTERPMHVVIPE